MQCRTRQLQDSVRGSSLSTVPSPEAELHGTVAGSCRHSAIHWQRASQGAASTRCVPRILYQACNPCMTCG